MKPITRRALLGGASSAALGLPFLDGYARAGGSEAPKRLVILWTPNDSDWTDQYDTPLPDGPLPATLPSFLTPLEGFRDRLAVARGLNVAWSGGHSAIGHALTGIDWVGPDSNNFWAGGPSVDQHIAQSLGGTSLTLGVSCGAKNGKGRLSYSAAQTPVDPYEDPAVAFNALFSDVGVDTAELDAQRAREHSILDRVASDLTAYSAQIPAEQRPRLEAHLEGIRALEDKIDDTLIPSCDPTAPGALDASNNALVPEVTRAQLDIIAQSMGCGATQVATLQFCRAGGDIVPSWPEDNINISSGLHTIAHAHYLEEGSASVIANAKAVEAWYSTQMAYLLTKLDEIPDVDGGTLLDNTLVVHAKELGRRHGTDNMVYTLAGGASMLTGRRCTSFGGRPHNDLLLTLCEKMGLPDTTFGDASVTTGTLTL